MSDETFRKTLEDELAKRLGNAKGITDAQISELCSDVEKVLSEIPEHDAKKTAKRTVTRRLTTAEKKFLDGIYNQVHLDFTTSGKSEKTTSGKKKTVSEKNTNIGKTEGKKSENKVTHSESIIQHITNCSAKTTADIKKKASKVMSSSRKRGMFGLGIGLSVVKVGKFFLKLSLGIVKTTANLVLGTVRLAFKTVFSVVKMSMNAISFTLRTAYRLISGTMSVISRITKSIVTGIGKLTTSLFKRVKLFLMTPAGMWLTGFVVGFVVGKVMKLYNRILERGDSLKKKYDEWKEDASDFGQNLQLRGFDVIDGTRDAYQKIKDKLKAIDFGKFKEDVPKVLKDLEDFLEKIAKGVSGSIGTLTGAYIGRVVATIVRTAGWGNIPGLGGVFVALGAIIGNIVGEWLASVPESGA